MKTEDEINDIASQHNEAPHLRLLQKALAEDITVTVHSAKALQNAIEASTILFGKATEENLKNVSPEDIKSIFDGVPQTDVEKSKLNDSGVVVLSVDEAAPSTTEISWLIFEW